MLQDARIYQILFLSLFLLIGIGTRDWTLHPEIVATAIGSCIATQLLAEQWLFRVSQKVEVGGRQIKERRQESGFDVASTMSFRPELKPKGSAESSAQPNGVRSQQPSTLSPLSLIPSCLISSPFPASILSALITSLGLSLLLRTDHITTMMLAAIAAILSKFMLRVNGKHIFNPANIGIVAAILLTQDAWISPGQWGEESWYALLFLGAGGIVLQRVGRWDTTIAFLVPYAALEAVRNLWLGWTWDVWAHRLMSGSLLLFALFMVTDPRTIPNDRIARSLWAIAIACLTFILRNVYFMPTAVFWALFALSPVTLLLDAVWPAPRFLWNGGGNTEDRSQESAVKREEQKQSQPSPSF